MIMGTSVIHSSDNVVVVTYIYIRMYFIGHDKTPVHGGFQKLEGSI